jgi:hypothetical protein
MADPIENLRQALELHEVGVAMVRARLRRDLPDLSDDEVEAQVHAWLGAEPLPDDPGLRLKTHGLLLQ